MRKLALLLVVLAVCAPAPSAGVSIRDIQYTTDPAGASPLNGAAVNCTGGVVTMKFEGTKPRVVVQDPSQPGEWGAIQVKDFTVGAAFFHSVAIGDFVSVSNVTVNEAWGTTMLQYGYLGQASGFAIVSQGNALPAALVVAPADIRAPVEGPPGYFLVGDHAAEKYESMLLEVRDVTIPMSGGMDLGKAQDNYVLRNGSGDCWASDYMNPLKPSYLDYTPGVVPGAHFDAMRGILEQYVATGYDYYQLLTVPEPGGPAILALAAIALLPRRGARREGPRERA